MSGLLFEFVFTVFVDDVSIIELRAQIACHAVDILFAKFRLFGFFLFGQALFSLFLSKKIYSLYIRHKSPELYVKSVFKTAEYALDERVDVFCGKGFILAGAEYDFVSHTLFTIFDLFARIDVEQRHFFDRAFRRLFYGNGYLVAGKFFVADEREISFGVREFRQRGKPERLVEFRSETGVIEFGDVNVTFYVVFSSDFVTYLPETSYFFAADDNLSRNAGMQIGLFRAFRKVEFNSEIIGYTLYCTL